MREVKLTATESLMVRLSDWLSRFEMFKPLSVKINHRIVGNRHNWSAALYVLSHEYLIIIR